MTTASARLAPAAPAAAEEPLRPPGSAIPTRVGPSYPKVRDPLTGKLVEDKPANRPYLKHQAWKAARASASSDATPPPAAPSAGWSAADVGKTIIWALMLVCVLGKFVTDSPVWGYEAELKRAFTTYVLRPKLIELTAHELSAFDGRSEPTDGGRPIYVAVAGDVYDVTVSRRIYGPGGSYHTLAGKDASRAFVTGCFQPHHLTHDLRGLSDDELKGLDHWHNFFATSKKYTLVGHVLLPPIDPSSPPPGPCLSEGEAEATFSGGESRGEKPVLDGSPHARPRGEL